VTDPVQAIRSINHRLARLSVAQTLTAMLPPIAVLAMIALGLRTLGEHSWERWGFVLRADSVRLVQTVLWCAAGAGLLLSAVLAILSFRRSNDPIAAAALIDRRLGCREEVLTLALAGSTPSSARSPLFPVLWRRASQHLDRLDPARNFPFQAKQTLRQALFLTGCTIGIVIAGISVLLAASQPPLAAEGRQLRKIAREIANSNPGDVQARELAERMRAVADTLDNPKIPPETKLEQLASVERQVKAEQQRRQQEAAASKGGSKATGKGSKGQGTGEAKAGTGQGKEGSGPGQGNDRGDGKGGDNTAKGGKGEVQLAEASKDISKVQARLEAEAKQKSGEQAKNGGLKARAPRPGEQPNLATRERPGNSSSLNRSKSNQEPGQEQTNRQAQQSGQQRPNYGSSQGDTHLGQFPRPGNFERFYKAGEHGEPLDVKNARYVLFRIPTALISAGGGKSVVDNNRPTATVPYANLPLKDERVAAEPDERQLIPPRYRDLLR